MSLKKKAEDRREIKQESSIRAGGLQMESGGAETSLGAKARAWLNANGGI